MKNFKKNYSLMHNLGKTWESIFLTHAVSQFIMSV